MQDPIKAFSLQQQLDADAFRPATEQETADWVEEYETIEGEQVYVGGHWREGTGHSENETINKDGKLVRWHIQVDNGMVRVKPGWIFTIEELAQVHSIHLSLGYGCTIEEHKVFNRHTHTSSDVTQLDNGVIDLFGGCVVCQ